MEIKNILITGASSGIGEALLGISAQIPSRIFVLARRANQIPDPPGLVSGTELIRIPADMADPHSVDEAVRQVLKKTERLDILFNNAGISAHGRFDELGMDVWRKTFATNFFGPIQLIQGLLPALKKGRGVVVTTSTVSALYGVPGRAAYSASKSALHAAMESLRIELKEEGVRSALVCVPYTKTNLRSNVLGADGKIHSEEQASGKLKTPEEVAKFLWEVSQKTDPRLFTMSLSGLFLKWMRNFNPGFLEATMAKKLKQDYQKDRL